MRKNRGLINYFASSRRKLKESRGKSKKKKQSPKDNKDRVSKKRRKKLIVDDSFDNERNIEEKKKEVKMVDEDDDSKDEEGDEMLEDLDELNDLESSDESGDEKNTSIIVNKDDNKSVPMRDENDEEEDGDESEKLTEKTSMVDEDEDEEPIHDSIGSQGPKFEDSISPINNVSIDNDEDLDDDLDFLDEIEDDDDEDDDKSEIGDKVPPPSHITSEPEYDGSSGGVILDDSSNERLWVDKYHPQDRSQIIGNRATVARIENWFDEFERRKSNGLRKKNDGFRKTVLLSGGPGIGKTTAARIIAQSRGYEVIEFNASDTRSKKSLEGRIKDLLNNRTMSQYFKKKKKKKNSFFVSREAKQSRKRKKKKVCILMDEVDGMGAGDRGGLAELVTYLNGSKNPILCICNDRFNQKMKTLASKALDVRFFAPRSSDIVERLKQILKNESVFWIPDDALRSITESLRCDIRSVINHVQYLSMIPTELRDEFMVKASQKKQNNNNNNKMIDEGEKNDVKDMIMPKKDFIMSQNVFNVTKELFDPQKKLRIEETMQKYFLDADLMPLFVQQNYASVRPPQHLEKSMMSRICTASNHISEADLIDRKIRTTQNYKLRVDHGFMSTVLVSKVIKGWMGGQGFGMGGGGGSGVSFPALLGNMSRIKKNSGVVREVGHGMSPSIGSGYCGNHSDVLVSDYFPLLRHRITNPLLVNPPPLPTNLSKKKLKAEQKRVSDEIVGKSVEFMAQYKLQRSHVDNLHESFSPPASMRNRGRYNNNNQRGRNNNNNNGFGNWRRVSPAMKTKLTILLKQKYEEFSRTKNPVRPPRSLNSSMNNNNKKKKKMKKKKKEVIVVEEEEDVEMIKKRKKNNPFLRQKKKGGSSKKKNKKKDKKRTGKKRKREKGDDQEVDISIDDIRKQKKKKRKIV